MADDGEEEAMVMIRLSLLSQNCFFFDEAKKVEKSEKIGRAPIASTESDDPM